jgi:hypothetical protein
VAIEQRRRLLRRNSCNGDLPGSTGPKGLASDGGPGQVIPDTRRAARWIKPSSSLKFVTSSTLWGEVGAAPYCPVLSGEELRRGACPTGAGAACFARSPGCFVRRAGRSTTSGSSASGDAKASPYRARSQRRASMAISSYDRQRPLDGADPSAATACPSDPVQIIASSALRMHYGVYIGLFAPLRALGSRFADLKSVGAKKI